MQKYIAILLVLISTNLLAQTYTDIDLDDDGLIEINDLETLNAMRYQLDGSGLQLSESAVEITTGCAPGGCKGYELTQDLDFNSADSYQNIANLKRWTDGAGWQPIGDAVHPFTAIFKTNNGSTPNVIYNLMINRPDESGVGLFGHIGSSARISGIGLLNAELSGHSQVGGLVGKSIGGDISNSYVSGRVVGKGVEVGSLAGSSSGSITNSYANGEVSGQGNGVGGLVGASSGSITNSYAMGSVVGAANHVGGLVGDNSQGTISNSYTTGSVSGSEDIGGLVGISNLGKLIGNYVSGKTSGKRYIGGLVGINVGGTITRSYWDKTTNDLKQNTGGVGLSASELQSQNAQDDDSKKPYYKWSTANWDFGTAEQYPVLKYATGSDPQNPVCGPGQTLPNCGALLLGQHASLERIVFSEQVDLSPTFKPTELNYQLNISPQITQLQLTPTASNPASVISISRNGVAVGTTSSTVTMDKDTSITIAVSAPNQRPAQYQFAVNYRHTITILGIPNETINEGELVILNASHSLDTLEDQISYRWTQTTGKAILSETANESASLLLFIPADYVPTTEDYAGLGLSIEVTDGKTTLNKNISLMIAKKDNGNIVVASPSLSDVELTAPEIDLSEDSDGAGNSFSYQWQHRPQSEDAEWTNLDDATDKTYTIPASAEWFTEYRVLIGYTDGQGYETVATSKATQYPSEEAIQDFIQSATPQRQSLQNAMSSQSSTTTTFLNCNNDGDIDDDNDGLIEICYLEDLDAIRYQLDGTGYTTSTGAIKITAGCPNTGCKGYELARDLDFNDNGSYRNASANKSAWTTGEGWQPIGNYVRYNNPNNNPFTATFEGNNHTLSNLMINRPSTNYVGMFSYIESTSTKITNVGLLNVNVVGDWHIGGLVGDNYAFITNSYATGSVKGTGNYVGGLAGWNSGSITNSYAIGDVVGDSYVGGLVGNNSGTITKSYATGSVKGVGSVGGLVGNNSNTITKSYATGDVEGIGSYVGGLVGDNYVLITNSYATGSVKGTGNYVGGLAGWNSGSITNSYAIGDVEGSSDLGGLVGRNWGTITNSYATGDVEGSSNLGGLVGQNWRTITNSYATGDVEGSSNLGGLVGQNWRTITNSYATGDVEGSSDLGGLVGNNYAFITNSYAIGDVVGDSYVGGLVGSSSFFTITNSYAAGSVKGTGNYVGGLVGINYFATIMNSSTKTVSQLQSPTTATGIYSGWSSMNWDFGTNSQYPVLKYVRGSDENNPACGGAGKPECGSLLLGQYPSPLDQLTISDGTLYPAFDEEVFNYTVGVNHDTKEITLNTTATDASIGISSNTTGTTTRMGAASAKIPLKIAGNTVITVELTIGNQRPTSYVITVSYYDLGTPTSSDITIQANKGGRESDIDENNSVDVNEGDSLELKLDPGSCSTKCEWDIPSALGLLLQGDPQPNGDNITFSIPVDYISPSEDSRQFTITVALRRPGGIAHRKITLKIIKVDNGHIEWSQPTLIHSLMIAPTPDWSTDPERKNESSETYQWQRLKAKNLEPTLDTNWMDITDATTPIYILSIPNDREIYRVGISYTDGQNNEKTLYSQVIEIGIDIDIDIDDDNDGLIEIRTLEDLDAIRYQLDGTGYRAGDALPKITTGCPDDGCRGYELIRDLDFNDDNNYSSTANKVTWMTEKGWQPIGNNNNPFAATFEGNDHTLSNLMINRPSTGYVGLFGSIEGTSTKITNVGLLNVNVKGDDFVGGLVGWNLGDLITNSYATGSVEGTGNYVGGLVGAVWFNTVWSCTITNSYATGSVKGRFNVGGLVGYNYYNGIITNSYAAGSVEGTGNYVGGLVGDNAGSITNSYATGSVKGRFNVGGLVGYNYYNGIITNSYAAGSVEGTGNYVGGLVGWSWGSITNSYVTGSVKGTGDYVGGLVGANDGPITNSYAIGNVVGDSFVGGLVGAAWSRTITNSYATGSVKGTGDYVGGLVGDNHGPITNSYAIGDVVGDSYVGGLVGDNHGPITNSYAIGDVVGDSYVGGLVGINYFATITNSSTKTVAQLQSPTTATGIYSGWSSMNWDFGTNNQYPVLKYAKGSDEDNPACGGARKPECGSLILGQLSFLDELAISNGMLSPAFDDKVFKYMVVVDPTVDNITLNTTATDASINIISNTTDTTTGTGVVRATIPLKIAGNTIITVGATKGNQQPKPYVIMVSYNLGTPTSSDITIKADGNDIMEQENVSVNEGDSLELKLDPGSCITKCEWDVPSALGSLLPAGARLNGETITFTNIPVDYISPSEDSRQFTITVALRRSGGIARRQITLTINKVDNGRIGNPGEATINGSSLIAPDLPDLSTDPDGVNDNSNISYQWQQPVNRNSNLDLDRSWMNITGATRRTYTPSNPEDGEIYRVRTSYTDKQGYSYTFTSKAVRDIDIDDDGLIEIRYLEDLDVIRNNLSGTSYKIDSIELSKGCPDSGCNGYELTKDLDFNDNGSYRNVSTNKNKWTTREGWEPIRDNFNSFSGIFQGNNHTISNLMINRPSSSYIGLFFMTSGDAMIDGVNLDKIKITGRNHVGTLVGKNLGSITNSNISGDDNTTSTRVKGEDHVGGLVGVNDRNAFVSNVDVYGLHVEGEDYIGGIAGENKGTIRSSRVSGTGNTMFTRVKGEDRVGGLVGVNGGNALVDNVDVYRLHVESEDYIGGLAGENKGTIRSSRVSGTGNTTLTQVIGRGDRIGGLVGSNERGKIFISHAIADVNGVIGHHVGGLVGYNTGRITNSYAAGSVIGNANVGGLIGSHEPGRVKNSYARAIVTGNSNKGGLVGSKLSNLNITNSYWDINVSGITEDGSNQGKTTEELQTTSTGIYSYWNPKVWDFGTSEQYPALKYYNANLCEQTNAPDYCGVLFTGQRSGLQSLQLSGNVILQDNFSNRQYDYNLIIGNGETAINLMPIASYPDAEIKLYQSDGSETTLINGVLNSDILLAASVSAMTIVVKDARSEVTYRFELERFEPSIDYTRLDYLMGYREGTTASLTAKITDQRRLMIDIDEVSFEWDSDLSPTMASGRFVGFVIPTNHIKDARTTATATVTLTATYKEQITSSISEGLLIIKFNNGRAELQSTTLTVSGQTLTAPRFVPRSDPDGGPDPAKITYQWEEQIPGEDWEIVGDLRNSTYEIPNATPAYTKYRVTISYKDEQLHSHYDVIRTEAYTYIELDADDNGLIDIYSATQLDAIRHQPNGTAYQISNDGESTTMGCPDGGCKGYELKDHIRLTDIWQPIDNLNTTFEGNGYTISNLNTTTTTIENAGMFSRTGLQAKIQNVGLINVAIKSGVNAGGLVGISNGIIANSYVVGNIIGGSNIDRSNAGGLVGINNGTISTSHAIVKVGNASSEYVGGLAGINNGTINNSYVIAKQLTGTSASKIGGIIGKTDNQDTSIVTNSYATVETIIKGGNRAGACSLSGDGDGIDDTSRMLGGNCIPSTLFGTGTTQ